MGGASILSPMYVSEVSPPSVRGRMGALYQLSIILGILISYAIIYLLRNTGEANWRFMFITGAVPAFVFLLLLLVSPETPRYLIMAGRHTEAFQILQKIAGPERAKVELEDVQASLTRKLNRWRDLVKPDVKPAVLVGFCLAILIHLSGINTIIDYAPAIFTSAGWKIDAALFSTFIVGLTHFAFTLVSFWIIDRYGRKPL